MVYSYEGIKSALFERLALLTNWRKILRYGTYDIILSVIAYVIDKRALYPAEYYYRESNIKTATTYPSVIAKAEYMYYTPYRKKGANGVLTLSADPTFNPSYLYTGQSVVIDRWKEFTNQSGSLNLYCTERTIYYSRTTGNIEIPIKEGIPKQYTYTASGVANEVITLHSGDVDNDEITVHIVDDDGNILSNVLICSVDLEERKLYFINNTTDYICEIYNSYDFQSIKIKFGNGISTRKLTAGTKVLIKYADTKGDLGNITTTDTITKIKTTTLNAEGVAATLYVTNDEAISDGSSYESIESIKENASNLFMSGYRCGGYNDWVIILQAHPLIHKAIIWSTDDVADDTITNLQNKVFISAITSDGDALTTTQRNDITVNYLKNKKSVTEIVSWQTLNVIFAVFRGSAKVQNLSFPIIREQINEALNTQYYILNSEFKQNIYESNFTEIIDSIGAVLYHNTELYHMEKGFTYNTLNHEILVSYTSSDTAVAFQQVYILPDSFEIWVKIGSNSPVMVGYDSSGSIVENNNTYIDILFTEGKLLTDSTGLANDATAYTANAIINSIGQPISITGSTAQTIATLITQLQSDLTDATVVFIEGDNKIRIEVTTMGGSTISFTDTNLISSLFSGNGGATLSTPVNGFKYTLSSTSINYNTNKVSFTVDDLSGTPPDNFDLSIMYKTKNGHGEFTNDIRLPQFNLITSTDDEYNEFNLSY